MNDSADQMRTTQRRVDERAYRLAFKLEQSRILAGEEPLLGYTLEEWREHLALTEQAKRAGTTPPPIRCCNADGSLHFMIVFRDGQWVHEFPEGPRPKRIMPTLADDQGFVYFIAPAEGPIKIGTAIDPQSRLVTLQTGSPYPLSILATCGGGRRQEKALHARFAAHRLHGEWFERHPDILAEIERLSNG